MFWSVRRTFTGLEPLDLGRVLLAPGGQRLGVRGPQRGDFVGPRRRVLVLLLLLGRCDRRGFLAGLERFARHLLGGGLGRGERGGLLLGVLRAGRRQRRGALSTHKRKRREEPTTKRATRQ